MRRLPVSLLSLAFCTFFVAARPAAATVVFTDNFDSETLAFNYTGFAKWTVSNGTVDLIGPGFFDLFPGNGRYVDLDGSTSDAGLLTTNISFAPGSYVLTFLLGGNQRDFPADTVFVSFGADNLTPLGITLNSGDPLGLHTITFTSAFGGTLSFEQPGGDNVGLILDNVTLEQVPEPGSLLLLGSGLAALGLWRRRRSA